VDGSPAVISHVEFEGVDVPVVTTLARRARAGRCGLGTSSDPSTVERVGVAGTSTTTLSERTGAIRACDGRTPGTWCGQAFARPMPRQALDPRLSVTCRGPDGKPVGFAWVVPLSRARYVVVRSKGYAEAYPVITGLPVRVTTLDIDLASSTARLDVSEHSAAGRRLADYDVTARVAG
jgi:hypothetical protein